MSALSATAELWADDAQAKVELARLIVDPRERGQGLGQRLAIELAGLAQSRYPRVFLRVHPGNIAAQRRRYARPRLWPGRQDSQATGT